jgi:hypothetical protein
MTDIIGLPLSKVPRARFDTGLFAARPATPEIVGQGYFATDVGVNGQLYVAYGLSSGNWIPVGAQQYTASGLESALPANPEQAGDRYFATDTLREWLGIDGSDWVNTGKGYGASKGILTITDATGALNALNAGGNGELIVADSTDALGAKYGTLGDVAYTPLVGADWTPDPDNAQDALDQLASRMQAAEGAIGGGGTGTMGGAKVEYNGGSTTANQNTWTSLSWQVEVWDTNSYWAIGQPTRLVMPATGYYDVDCQVETNGLPNTTTIHFDFRIILNGNTGSPILQFTQSVTTTTSYTRTFNINSKFSLTAADYIEIQVRHNYSPSIDFGSAGIATFAIIERFR